MGQRKVTCETYTDRGIVGERGASAYEQAVEGGYTGTLEQFEDLLAEDLNTLADNISDVVTTAENISDVHTVATDISNVNTVASNLTDISTVAGISSDISAVSAISSDVSSVSANNANITAVSENLTTISNVESNLSDINTVAGISTDVSAVAGIAADISAVEDIKTDVSAVAANTTNITAVAGNETNINAVNSNKTNIDAVAGNSTNINAVAGNEANINAVNANKTNIDAVAGNNTNINTVATNISNVNTAATNMAAIIAAPTAAQNAATSATNAQKWAEGTDSDVTPLGGTHSSKGWANRAQQIVESIGAIYKPAGSITFASLPALSADVLGNVYNITDAFTTTADFVEGAGNNYPAGTNVAVVDVGTGGSHSYKFDVLSGVVDLSAYRTAAAQDVIDSGKQATLVSGTNIKTVNNNSLLGSGNLNIDTLPAQSGQSGKFLTTNGTSASWAAVDALPSQTGQSGKFLTTDGTDASWANLPIKVDSTKGSINIASANSTNDYAQVMIGTSAQASNAGSIAIGRYAKATNGSVHIGNMEGVGTKSISIKGSATAAYAIQLGGGPSETYSNNDANTFKVGNANGNYELMSADGTIPVARLNPMTGADGANAGAKGAVPAPAATDNTKFLKGDGTWAAVDALPSQTGNQGKYLTTNGTTASWDIPMAGLPMFYATYQPRKLNNASWLRADPYSWHSADVYVSAYAHLADNISGVTAETETIAGTTITFYPLSDEIKVVLPDQETNLDAIYNATGIGYYFVLDTTNRQFKLPRNIYGFTGYRGDVGGYVEESLPSFVALCGYDGQTGAYRQKTVPYTYRANTYQQNLAGVADVDVAYGSEVANKEDAPVQQRATQAYLYFYVGNTVQNETSVDVAEMTEAINDKVDLSSSWGAPSSNYIDLTLGSSGDSYTAPADGYFVLDKQSTANGQMGIFINSTSFVRAGEAIYNSGAWIYVTIPARKGDNVFCFYDAGGTTNMFRFVYVQKTN